MAHHTTHAVLTLADKGKKKGGGDLIPNSPAKKIPGLSDSVGTLISYGLYLLILAGLFGIGVGVYKLATSDKSRNGNGAEPFKWMGGGLAAVLISGSLVAIVNGVAK